MANAFLIPKSGHVVRDPRTRMPLPAEGAEVEMGSFWHRRIADGDVSIRQAKAATPKPSVAKRAAESSSKSSQE